VLTIEPHIESGVAGRLPDWGTDYEVGDTVRVRIAYNEVPRIDALMRVWGVTANLDEQGVERLELLTAEEGT
jgi:hypothetical protein